MAASAISPQENPSATAPKRGLLMSRILIGIFIAIVVLIECLFAYYWIPRGEEQLALDQDLAMPGISAAGDLPDEPLPAKQAAPAVEVDLGNYSITAYQPASNTSLRIDFHLFGTVLEEEKQRFPALFARHEHRFRDQIIFLVRNAELTDLTDPGLGLIKRRILEKSNQLFGKRVLQSVVFSDFSFVEQ